MRRASNTTGLKPASLEDAAEAGLQAAPPQRQAVLHKKSSRRHGHKPATLSLALSACALCCALPFVLAASSSAFRAVLMSHQMRLMGLPPEWAAASATSQTWASISAAAHASASGPIPEAQTSGSVPHLLKPLAHYEEAAERGPFPVHLRYNVLWNGMVLTQGGYGNEAISFFEALLGTGMVRPQDLWWAQAGDSVSPHNAVLQGLEPGMRKLLEQQNYRNMSQNPPQSRDRPIISIGHTFPTCWRRPSDDSRIRLGAHLVGRTAQLALASLMGQPALDPICPCPNTYTKDRVVYRIGRSMFETEVLPLKLAAYAHHVDEVWVPSFFNVQSFTLAHVDAAKLFILPQGVNTTLFDPDHADIYDLDSTGELVLGSANSAIRNHSSPLPYRFLSIFKWEARKAWDVLLTAFVEEFKGSRDVELHIVTKQTVQKISGFPAYIRKVAAPYLNITHPSQYDSLPRVFVHAQHIPESQFPGLYKAVNALVIPTHGEGWGRPQMEAMAMAMPVISTNWSGVTAYLNEYVGYPLRVEAIVEAKDEGANSFGWFKHQRWAQPSKQHLRQLMHNVIHRPAQAAAKGAAARRMVLHHYTLSAVARKLLAHLLRVQDAVDHLLQRSPNIL